MEGLRARLIGALFGVASIVGLGSSGYYLLGDGRWTVIDCLYMTVITLATVGYGETLPGYHEVPYIREYTMLLIVGGISMFVYFASNVTATIIEGDLRAALKKTRMRKQIAKMKDHLIVCGAGSTGRHILQELVAARVPLVVIDIDQKAIDEAVEEFGEKHLRYVLGDATDDGVLSDAALAGARGLVAALPNDKDNLYLVVTTRQAYPSVRIVARGSNLSVLDKLRRAGADAVVSPSFIGGLRMASEILRPKVVQFLDEMLRSDDRVRISEIQISERSTLVGQKLVQAEFRQEDLLVLAIKLPATAGWVYNPRADTVLESGMTLVLLGAMDRVEAARRRTDPAVA
jgi:voltage-gated potassium channel